MITANRIVPYWKWVYWQQPNINYNKLNWYTHWCTYSKQTGLFYRCAICVFKRNIALKTNFFCVRIWKNICISIQFEWGNCIVERWTSKSIYCYLSEYWIYWNENAISNEVVKTFCKSKPKLIFNKKNYYYGIRTGWDIKYMENIFSTMLS